LEFLVEYEVRETGGGVEVRLQGRLTFDSNGNIRKIVDSIGRWPNRKITVDVGELDFIDSAGLGMLMILREEAVAKNASLSLRGAQGQVLRLFTASQFGTIVPMAGV
jgi:stage II sporulation protein AA (anti-sigma F factor antagonist)